MKKWFVILEILLFILFIGCFFLYNTTVVQILDIENKSEPAASKILYDFVMNELEDSSKKYAEITLGRTHAYEIDLNNDGVNEVIGVVLSPYYCTDKNCSLFILKKDTNIYKNIVSDIKFSGKIFVKRHLTNGYKDIELFVPYLKSGLQFKNGQYDWAYYLKGITGFISKKFYADKILDFAGTPVEDARRVVFDYIKKDTDKTDEELKELSPTLVPEAVTAYYVDLNDDGVDEVVGFIYSAYEFCVQGFRLFVLQKQGDEYADIAGFSMFEPQYSVYILNHKTNGYKDIKFSGSVGVQFRSFVKYFGEANYEF